MQTSSARRLQSSWQSVPLLRQAFCRPFCSTYEGAGERCLDSAVLLLATAHDCCALWPGTWPVVIVGAGPTGLTLSTLLSKFGLPSLLLERAPALTQHPQVSLIPHPRQANAAAYKCADPPSTGRFCDH